VGGVVLTRSSPAVLHIHLDGTAHGAHPADAENLLSNH
jgi:hypothetical protein